MASIEAGGGFIIYRSHRQPAPRHHPISPNVSGDVGADNLGRVVKVDCEHTESPR